MSFTIPLDIPIEQQKKFIELYKRITKDTGRLFIFAADQKMEHLNADFFGEGIPQEVNNPAHVFSIAEKSPIGAFATHLGLINRYGEQYSSIDYIAKLDGKTNATTDDPYSQQLWSVDDALLLEKKGISLCGVGYTIYLGSKYEKEMLTEAANIVSNGHKNGLVAILWIYPRGGKITDEHDPDIIAGAAGVGASLGADFVKVQKPLGSPHVLQQAVSAAGNTKIIVSGGSSKDPLVFFEEVYNQIHEGKVAGGAIGRNIFQYKMQEACAIAMSLSGIIYKNMTIEDATQLYKTRKK